MPAQSRKSKASAKTLAESLKPRLAAADAARTKTRLAELAAAAKRTPLAKLIGKARVGGFVAAAMECSPFLRGLMLADPERLAAILSSEPAMRMKTVIAATARAWRGTTEVRLMATLRKARQEVALITALADLGGLWDVVRVTAALTDFADAAVVAAGRFLLSGAAEAGVIA